MPTVGRTWEVGLDFVYRLAVRHLGGIYGNRGEINQNKFVEILYQVCELNHIEITDEEIEKLFNLFESNGAIKNFRLVAGDSALAKYKPARHQSRFSFELPEEPEEQGIDI